MHTSKPYYLVLDFEANCSSDQVRDHEIIEFPAVLVEAYSGRVVNEFRSFVKMVTHKQLSQFIKDLTHITDEEIARGLGWCECLLAFESWCHTNGITPKNCTVVTCGDWDLKTMLANQLQLTKTKLTLFLDELFGCWTNVKITYRDTLQTPRQSGMDAMLNDLGIPLVGHHHSGIDDCRNIAKICHCLLTKYKADVTLPNKMRETPLWYDEHKRQVLRNA